MNRVWVRIMVWMARRLRRDVVFCVCTNEQQTTSKALGKGNGRASCSHTSVVHACQPVSLSQLPMSQQRNGINSRKFSHLGHLDFEIERGDDGANLCVFRLLYSGWKNHI